MKGRDVSFIGMVALVIGGLQTLSVINKPPLMPRDSDHTRTSREGRDVCLRCHQAQSMAALEQATGHPVKWRDERTSCQLCHIPEGNMHEKSMIPR